MTNRRAVAVHRRVAAAQHHNLFAFHVDEIFRRLFKAQVAVDVGDQEIQRIVHARQVFTGKTTFHVGVGAHAHKDRVVLFQQLLHADVFTDFGIETELDTHASEDFATMAQYGFFQFELRDPEGQQPPDFRVLVEHHRRHTAAHQHVGTAQTRRPGTDNGNALASRHHLGHVRAPAHSERGVGDVLLNRTDGHCAKAVIEGASTLAQTVLRAHPATHFRQCVGLVRQLGGSEDVALGHQLEPVGNEVMHRAFPFTVRITATQAAMSLLGRLLGFEGFVDFHELFFALT